MTTPYPIAPPIEPMLAKLATEVPDGGRIPLRTQVGWFSRDRLSRWGDVFIQSRDLKPLDRYFPECTRAGGGLPDGCVLDGEIVIATPRGLDFDALQMRLHPAASRVAKLALETPAAFVAFDALAIDGQDLRGLAQHERRVSAGAIARRRRAADPSDADDARPWPGGGMARTIRRCRPRWRDRQARRRHLSAWQARR